MAKTTETAPVSPTPAGSGAGAPAPEAAAGTAAKAAATSISNYDGTAISDKVQVILVSPYNDTVGKLKAHFVSDDRNKVYEASGANTPVLARALTPCLVVASIVQNTDVVKLLGLLKSISADVKKNAIKFLVFSKIKNQAIIKTFEDFGCHEYIVEPIAERSMRFKVDLHTRALYGQRKNMRRAELARQDAAKNGGKDAGETKKKESLTDDSVQELKKKEDGEGGEVFVFKGSQVKKNGKKWTMRMKGPDPSNGDWMEMGKDESGQSQWRYVEKGQEPGSPAAKKDAHAWSGDKPEFINGEWQFSSEKPKLAVVDENGKVKESKISADADGLNIGKDSKLPAWKVKDQFQEERRDKKDAGEEKKIDEAKAKEGKAGKNGKEDTDSKKPGGLDFRNFAMADDEAKKDPGGLEGKKGDEKSAQPKLGFDLGGDDEEVQWNPKTEAELGQGGDVGTGLAGGGMGQKAGAKKVIGEKGYGGKAESKEDESEEGKKRGGLDFRNFAMPDDESGPKKASKSEAAKKGAGEAGAESGAGDKNARPGRKGFGFGAKDGDGASGPPKDGDEERKAIAAGQKAKNPFGKKTGDEPGADSAGIKGRKPRAEAAEAADVDPRGADNTSLAGLAMAFDEDGKPLARKKGDEPESEIGGRSDAKTEHIKNKKWQGHDLTPDELLEAEEREKREEQALGLAELRKKKRALEEQQAIKPGAKKSGAKGEVAEGEEEEGDESLSGDSKNFLGKDAEAGSGSSLAADDKPAGGQTIGTGDIGKRTKWSARDSEQETKDEGEDKLVEVDGVKARMKVGEDAGAETFEVPADQIGPNSGTWEATGPADRDEANRKLLVYIAPNVRTDRKLDVAKVPTWWTYRGEARPTFNAKTQMWVFKGRRPERVEGFARLTATTRAFILSIAAGATQKQVAEAATQARAEALEKKNEQLAKAEAAKAAKKKEAEAEAAAASALFNKKKKSGADEASASGGAGTEKKRSGQDPNASGEAIDPFAKKRKKDGGEADAKSAEAASSDPFGKKKKKGDAEAGTEIVDPTAGKRGARSSDAETEAEAVGEPPGASNVNAEGETSGAHRGEKSAGTTEATKAAAAGGELAGSKGSTRNEEVSLSLRKPKGGQGGGQDGAEVEAVSLAKKRKPTAPDEDESEASANGLPIDPRGEGSTDEAPAETGPTDPRQPPGDSGAAEAGAERQKKLDPSELRLPAAPMVAVVLSELLMRHGGDVPGALLRYLGFLSTAFGGAKISIFAVRERKGRLLVTGHDGFREGQELNLATLDGAAEALERRAVHIPGKPGAIYCPIHAAGAPEAQTIGLLVIDPGEALAAFTGRERYLNGVAQCLRGAVDELGRTAWATKEEAA